MEEYLVDRPEPENQRKRPVLLRVLCMLTWTGSAGLIWFFGWLFLSIATSVHGKADKLMLWLLLIYLVCSVLSAAGGIVMWKLRKWGFYVYTIAQLVPVLLTVYSRFLGYFNLERGAPLAVATFLTWMIVPLVFVVLYATQLKHFRKKTAANQQTTF
jgi:hypothetical protein